MPLDEILEPARSVRRDDAESPCTCWWGAYVKPGGGTGFDIARYDVDCPEHGEDGA